VGQNNGTIFVCFLISPNINRFLCAKPATAFSTS